MRLTGSWIIASLTAAAAVSPALAEAHAYIVPHYFQSSFTGEARVTGGDAAIPGTDFDLEDTLDVDPDIGLAGLDGFVKLGGMRLNFSYYKTEAEGSTTLDELVVFDGEPFIPGTEVDTNIDFLRYKAMFGFDISAKVVNVGFLFGAHWLDIEATLESSLGQEQTEDLKTPVPAVGVALGIHPLPWLAIHGEVSGMAVNISDYDISLIDGFAGVDFFFVPKIGVSIGYRYYALDAEDEDQDNAVDILQRGAYAGLSFHI